MIHISHEGPEETHRRLLRVIASARVEALDEEYTFKEYPAQGSFPSLDRDALAAVRDEQVWSVLVPATPRSRGERFSLVRFHFPAELDNSGFVGWLASHLKRSLGTGVFVICGHNSADGGIFDYAGFPAELREPVLREIESLRDAGFDEPRASQVE